MRQDADENLAEWLDAVDHLTAVPWDRLPELDLYMDQVITLMNKDLSAVSVESDRPLTPSMINNYVKDGVMPRPNQKKYDRDHMTVLLMICMLKSVFSLPEIKQLVRGLSETRSMEELYPALKEAQIDTLKETADSIRDIGDMEETDRYLLVLQLALEANAARIVAARILESLADPDEPLPKEKKHKKERKEKLPEE